MSARLIDTNVAIAANGRNTHASADCKLACTEVLIEVFQGAIVVLDNKRHILAEYLRNLYDCGEPGVGDKFLKYVLVNQHSPDLVRIVPVTPVDSSRRYEEFPSDPALCAFDQDDKVFVATSLSDAEENEIIVALDQGWAIFHHELASHGIKVVYACPDHVTA